MTRALVWMLYALATLLLATPAWAQHEIAIAVDIESGLHVYRGYSQRTGLFYVGAWDNYYSTFTKSSETPLPWRRGAINTWTDDAGHGSIMAIDPATGDKKWEFKMYDVTDSGILTTDGDVLFSGGREGNFYALDARTGTILWKTSLAKDRNQGPHCGLLRLTAAP
ncbi:MAG: PQQ-binding-like beta-propeller repeat protein [Acidobacteriota bacterium]